MARVPLISVLMATFNGEAFLQEAIASALGQHGCDVELVVTDDGSTDATSSIVSDLARRDPRLRFAIQRHAGMASARNASLARARGSYIALLDQDDCFPDGKLARQLALLDVRPELAAVFGRTEMFGVGGRRDPAYTMLLSAALLRREAIEAVGEFDPSYTSADDFDFLMRMIESGHKIALEAGLGVHHRRHHRQVSSNLDATRRECVRALAASLQRRRRRGLAAPLHHPLVARALP